MKLKLTIKDVVGDELSFDLNKHTSIFHQASRMFRENTIIDWDVYLESKGINLQRPFCWSLEQKSNLIISIIKEIPIPPFSVVQKDNDKFKTIQIIDGKQRLNAIYTFLNNEFPLYINNSDYYFDDLDEDLQRKIRTFPILGDIAYEDDVNPISDNEKIKWFNRINFGGTPQDVEHMKKLKTII